MTSVHKWILGLLLVGLTGCTAGDVQVNPRYMGSYTLTDRNYAAAHGLATELIGNPFDAPESELRRAVTETIRTSHLGQPFRMLDDDDADRRSPYKVVLAFDQRPGYGLCRTAPSDATPAATDGTGDIRVYAAFCARDRILTSTRGRVTGATGPDDPRFRRLISQVGFELFPPFDETKRDNDGRRVTP